MKTLNKVHSGKIRTSRLFPGAKNLAKMCIVAAILTSGPNLQAQPFTDECLVNEIDISTGVDHVNGVSLPYSTAVSSVTDPYWMVTMIPTNTVNITAPICAYLVDTSETTEPKGTWTSDVMPNSRWISFDPLPSTGNLGAGSGLFWLYHHNFPGQPINNGTPIRFTRKFYIEGTSSQNVDITLSGFGDDIVFARFDATPGIPIYNTPTSIHNIYYNATQPTTGGLSGGTITISKTLPAGMHTIDIDLYDISGIVTGINLEGTLHCDNQVLVSNNCYGINESCVATDDTECNDLCYWRVTGNNINGNNNIFGTLSPHNVRIQTEGSDRGIYTRGGANSADPTAGRFGWNTMSPTARLHVNCDFGNEDGSGQSDIRFENLEAGEGEILVISPDGYVFNSHMPVGPGGGLTNNCGTPDFVTKTDPSGNLNCSQIYDNGISVGINKTSGFSYSGGGAFTAGNPALGGTVLLDVNGMFRSITMVATSDAKYKTNVSTLERSLEKVMQLNPVEYNWKNEYREKGFDDLKHTGFIAQELAETLPNSVVKDDNGDYAVDYNSIIPVLTQAIQEQHELIAKLQERVALLEATTRSSDMKPATSSILYQNTPNPFRSETTIRFYIAGVHKQAFIVINDLNGKEMNRYSVNTQGEGEIKLQSGSIAPGTYIYSLIVDGQTIDTKRMVITE